MSIPVIVRTKSLFLIVLAATMAACTFPGSGRDGGSDTPARPKEGGKLTIAWVEPDSISPSNASARTGLLLLKQICDSLVLADPYTGELMPGTAESWTISSDAKKVTFKLRSGLKFHNGRDITAQDYVYSISRFVRKDVGSRQAFLLDKLAGYGDAREGKTETIAGVKALDAATLEVELAEPFAEVAALFAHPAAGSAIPKEEVDKGADSFNARPVCNGPYMLNEPWQRGKDLTLVRHSDYKEGERGQADSIVFRPVADLEEGYSKLNSGTVDVAEVPNAKLAQARQVRNRVDSGDNGIVAMIGFPVTKAPFDNRDFRTGLSLAIDRNEIIERKLAGSRGMPDGFLPVSVGPVSEDHACKNTVKPKADVARAKEAFQKSGIPAPTLNVYFNPDRGHETWLEVVAKQWQETLGITSNLAAKGDPGNGYAAFLVDGADGPFRWAWLAAYPSAESIFGPTFVGGSLDNYSRFASAEFDGAVKKARATVDDDERRKLYVDAGAILCRELPMTPVWMVEAHIGFRSGIASSGKTRIDVVGDPVLRNLGRA